MIEIDRPLLRHAAAQLRASLGVKTPDAIQLAAGIFSGCEVFLTHDRDLPPMRGLDVVQIGHYV